MKREDAGDLITKSDFKIQATVYMQVSVNRNLSKIGPNLKISPCTPSVLNEVVTKGAFFTEVHVHPLFTYATIHAVIQEAPTVQEEGLTNESRYHLLLHMYDLRGTEV